MKLAPVCLFGAALLGRTTSVLACGASAEPYYVLQEPAPRGGGVPLNAPLVVTLAEDDGPAERHLDPSLTLRPSGAGEAVALRAIGSAPRLVWVPSQPLAPDTEYEARFSTGYEGASVNVWQFTTNAELRPPVSLEGELRVTFEGGTEAVMECSNDCGTDCKQVGMREVTRARLRLPRAVLGFPSYRAEVRLTDDTPYDFSPDARPREHVVDLGTSVSYDERGEPREDALFTLPGEDAPYRPCFALRVVDERGDVAAPPPWCAEQTFPFAERPGSSLQPPQHDSDDAAVGGASSACSFGPASRSWLTVWGPALALGILVRRRCFQAALSGWSRSARYRASAR